MHGYSMETKHGELDKKVNENDYIYLTNLEMENRNSMVKGDLCYEPKNFVVDDELSIDKWISKIVSMKHTK